MLLLAVWVKNRRLHIKDKLEIIFIINGPLGRKKRASINPPLESFNHSSLSPSFVGLKIFTLGKKYYTVQSKPSVVQDPESKDIVSCFTFVVKRKSEKLGSTKASHYVHADLM